MASQFCIPTLFGADGYFHIRIARITAAHGLIRDFHWARFSVFATHFADKDFLYHLFLIPFTFFGDIFFGAKVSACVFVLFLYAIFFWVLRRHCVVRSLIPLFLLAFFASAPFLLAINQPRNMVMVIGLTLLFVHFLINENHWGVFAVSVVYALSHVSSPYLLVFMGMVEAVRFLRQRRVAKR
ncbi:MAG: hypothetical protein KKC84_02220, partial [Candidatus Omnitrophica bacterium]|nr:hypothetical protein [Candidatus Omnitrophota bacterium]